MKKVSYKFIGTKVYHNFLSVCYKNGISVLLETADKNLNKPIKVFRRYIIVTENQMLLLKDFNYRIVSQ